jgi:hypothetical protein
MPHATPAHALGAVQARLKSFGDEGYFSLEADRVIRPYLPLHCSGVTEICHMTLPTHALRAV